MVHEGISPETPAGEGPVQPLRVFEKVVATPRVDADTRWLTMLPGYPDGSYGYAQVDRYLGSRPGPRTGHPNAR